MPATYKELERSLFNAHRALAEERATKQLMYAAFGFGGAFVGAFMWWMMNG